MCNNQVTSNIIIKFRSDKVHFLLNDECECVYEHTGIYNFMEKDEEERKNDNHNKVYLIIIMCKSFAHVVTIEFFVCLLYLCIVIMSKTLHITL